jgi:hypothetical protein
MARGLVPIQHRAVLNDHKDPAPHHLHIVTPYWRIGKLLRRKTNASESNIPVNDSGASNKSMAEFAASETAQTPPQVKF